jgi:hypothetical protein
MTHTKVDAYIGIGADDPVSTTDDLASYLADHVDGFTIAPARGFWRDGTTDYCEGTLVVTWYGDRAKRRAFMVSCDRWAEIRGERSVAYVTTEVTVTFSTLVTS